MSSVGELADYSNPALSPNEELLAISRWTQPLEPAMFG